MHLEQKQQNKKLFFHYAFLQQQRRVLEEEREEGERPGIFILDILPFLLIKSLLLKFMEGLYSYK